MCVVGCFSALSPPAGRPGAPCGCQLRIGRHGPREGAEQRSEKEQKKPVRKQAPDRSTKMTFLNTHKTFQSAGVLCVCVSLSPLAESKGRVFSQQRIISCGLACLSLVWSACLLACRAGCVGGPIQYYAEASHQHQPAAPGAAGPTTGSTPAITSSYCGVESYWQIKPGQLRNLIASVSRSIG